MTIKPLKLRLTNLHSNGTCIIKLLMTKLKLSYNSWTKNSDCLLFKSNIAISLLLKNKMAVLSPKNQELQIDHVQISFHSLSKVLKIKRMKGKKVI
jgi:hypothetical protein